MEAEWAFANPMAFHTFKRHSFRPSISTPPVPLPLPKPILEMVTFRIFYRCEFSLFAMYNTTAIHPHFDLEGYDLILQTQHMAFRVHIGEIFPRSTLFPAEFKTQNLPWIRHGTLFCGDLKGNPRQWASFLSLIYHEK